MLDRKLQSWFYPEPTGDVGRDRNARTLQFTCFLLAFAVGAVLIVSAIDREWQETPLLVFAIASFIAAAVMNRAGRSDWAGRTAFVAVLLGAILLVFQAHDGFRSHSMLVFPGLLLISVMMLDRASYVMTAGIVVVAVAALGIAAKHGLTQATPPVRTTYDSIFYVDLNLLVIAIVGSRIASDAQRNVFDLRASVERLSSANLELTKAAEALRRSESLARARTAELQAIMDAAPAVILVANDAECRHVGGNRTAYALMRQKPGTNLSMAAPEDERPTNRRVMQDGIEIPLNEMPLHKAAFTGQPIRNYDLEVVFEDGTSIDLLGNVEPIPDEKGVPRGVVAVLSDITERKRAEQALRESEERFRFAQKVANIGTFDWNVKTGVNMWTPELEAMYGLPIGGFGRTQPAWEALVHPDDRARAVQRVEESFETGTPVEAEWRVIRPDGSLRWLAGRWQVVKDATGEPLRMMGVNIDVTDGRQMEEALRDSEERFRLAITATNDAIWDVDLKTGTVSWNETYSTLYGRPRETSDSWQWWIDRIHPEDRERTADGLRRAISSGASSWTCEYRFPQADGRWAHIYDRAHIARDTAGAARRVIGAMQDLTERKRAEEALRENEQRLVSIYNTVRDVIFHLAVEPDGQLRFVSVNAAFLSVTGLSLERVVGKTLNEVIPEPSLTRVLGKYRQAVEENTIVVWEETSDYPTGRLTGEVSIAPVFDNNGNCTHLVGSVHDVTERNRAEETLRRNVDEIAHLNRVAALGEMATSLAHELNQPLAAILTNAEAASRFLNGKSPNLARVRGCLTAIAADDERAAEVIKRLRSLLKKDQSQASLIDLNEVVSDALRLVNHDATIHETRVRIETHTKLAPVLVDRVQLCQVVLNLLVNGLQAAAEQPPAERWVLVRTAKTDGGCVELTVEDSGKGIAEGDLARVFEPFFTTKREGLGMGLSISQSIVQANGGRVWVENSARHGAVFHCVLPVAQQGGAAATT